MCRWNKLPSNQIHQFMHLLLLMSLFFYLLVWFSHSICSFCVDNDFHFNASFIIWKHVLCSYWLYHSFFSSIALSLIYPKTFLFISDCAFYSEFCALFIEFFPHFFFFFDQLEIPNCQRHDYAWLSLTLSVDSLLLAHFDFIDVLLFLWLQVMSFCLVGWRSFFLFSFRRLTNISVDMKENFPFALFRFEKSQFWWHSQSSSYF